MPKGVALKCCLKVSQLNSSTLCEDDAQLACAAKPESEIRTRLGQYAPAIQNGRNHAPLLGRHFVLL